MTATGADPTVPLSRADIGAAFRDQSGQVLATLIRVLGDFDAAEDALQEACIAALEHWPRDGMPDRPGAWLLTTARRKALDRIRREAMRDDKHRAAARLDDDEPEEEPVSVIADDRLRLIFTCCHPALPVDGQVALTLRTLGGLTVAEIARAFGVPEATMAQRLVRARRKIKVAGIPYQVPPSHVLPERMPPVLAVLYYVFNEGYAATAGPSLLRDDLSAEAIRLTRLLVELMPDEAEATGLLALMLLHDARRPTRTDRRGDLVLLADQDRSRWDRAQIDEGVALVEHALRRSAGRPGPYQLQAAIAAVHDEAPSVVATDWPQIVALYGELARLVPTAVVGLNQAVATAMAEGPAVGLARIDAIDDDGSLATNHLFHAARGDLLARLGRPAEAAAAFRTALELVGTDAERRLLERRLAGVADGAERPGRC